MDTKAELGTAVFFNVEKCSFSIIHVYILGPEGMNVKHSNLNVKSCGPGLLLKPRLKLNQNWRSEDVENVESPLKGFFSIFQMWAKIEHKASCSFRFLYKKEHAWTAPLKVLLDDSREIVFLVCSLSSSCGWSPLCWVST